MKKVLVFGMTENPGGIESVIINYYRKIDRNKLQFDFLCNSYNKIAYEDEIISLGGNTIHFPARSKNYFKYKKELNNFFKKHSNEYESIWVNVCSLANIDYLILAKKYGIRKRIIHSHNSENMDSRLRGLLHSFNKNRITKYATDFWACSKDAAKWFYDDRIALDAVIIHNAIDLTAFSFNKEKRALIRKELNWNSNYIIGNIGRLHFQKNQKFILDIFKKYMEINPSSRLVLVGDGEDRQDLEKKCEELGISKYVKFAGIQNNIGAWLSGMDLFLFPSVFEGLSLAALEAQAEGIPVLASNKVIPIDAKINDNFIFFDLSMPAEEWAREIEKIRKEMDRENPDSIRKSFEDLGFDIKTEVKKLEKLLV